MFHEDVVDHACRCPQRHIVWPLKPSEHVTDDLSRHFRDQYEKVVRALPEATDHAVTSTEARAVAPASYSGGDAHTDFHSIHFDKGPRLFDFFVSEERTAGKVLIILDRLHKYQEHKVGLTRHMVVLLDLC